ncbi:8189_t:CDS:2 [Cetraspora pellucida]|uniref:8189_t:CDS:1 n=1 Tax=Cetraspora pellucida TaxID=1433469 RepID=A0A9N9HR24_9GLOM|nr:8189_t:CDS:2 [Cetraspora pellucida]
MPNNSLMVEDPEAQQLINLSYVTNTEKNTSKWLHHVDRYREEKNITKMLNQFNNKEEFDVFLSRYLHKNSAIEGDVRIWDKYLFPRALRCLNGKMKSLQNNSYSNTSKSDSLTSNKIISCLNHNYLSVDNNKGLIKRVFFWLSLLCRLREEKHNQGGVLYRQYYGYTGIRFIPIPPDHVENQFTSIKDLLLYLLKRPTNCESKIKNSIWYKPLGWAFDVPEDEAIIFSGHCSCEALLIPYTSYNEDLESYYSFLGDSYINYNSDKNDEIDILVIETSSTLDLSQEDRILQTDKSQFKHQDQASQKNNNSHCKHVIENLEDEQVSVPITKQYKNKPILAPTTNKK